MATNNELAKYVEYLKEENKILLRARVPGQIHTTPEARSRLLKLGKAIGRAIEELITIVSPATFYCWVRDEKIGKGKSKNPKCGQRKPTEIRELVIQIAKDTGFGYTRIIGKLRKLGVKKISRQTVQNILKEEGIEPGPNRTSDKRDNFVKRHAKTLLVSEFGDYYNHRRSHMERGHLPPVRQQPAEVTTLSIEQTEVREYVGGLVKSFERKAA